MTASDKWTTQLHKLGLKATPLRKALLEFLLKSDLPIDAKACGEYLTQQQISFDPVNVYRNLDTFVEKGIAKKVDFHDGKYYYEKVSDCSHLICQNCGKIEHIHMESTENISRDIKAKTGFEITQQVNDFFGTCQKCQN